MPDLPLTETQNPRCADLDTLETLELLRRINEEDASVAAAVGAELGSIAAAVDAIVPRMREGGRLHYFGAGTSGRLAVLDAAEIPPTFSTPPDLVVGHVAGGTRALTEAVEEAEDDAAAGAAAVEQSGISRRDAVVGLSASGGAPYVVGAIRAARAVGALTVAIANTPGSPLAAAADLAIVMLTGPEVITGSTRMKAATAQKMVLNSISTALMVKLGKVYGNRMVDLRATNAKLRARAQRIVIELSGASPEAALNALEANEWDVRRAVVFIVSHASTAADAAQRLDAAGGNLRTILARYPRLKM